jgi:phage major head subunit gpT-like protein
MALVNKNDILYTAYREGGRQLHQAYGDLLKTPGGWQTVSTQIRTNTETLDLGFVKDHPRFEQVIGSIAFSDLVAAGYTVTTDKYAAGVKIKDEELKDDLLNLLIDRIRQMVDAPADKYEELVFDAYLKGIATTTYGACYDGQAFFSAAHPVGSSTDSNYDSGGSSDVWYLIDASKSNKPVMLVVREEMPLQTENEDSSHFFEAEEYRSKITGRVGVAYGMWQQAYASDQTLNDQYLWAAIQAMREMTNDNGSKLNIKPTHLLVPPSLERTAKELLIRNFRGVATGGTTDFVSVSNEPVSDLNIQLVVSPWLA